MKIVFGRRYMRKINDKNDEGNSQYLDPIQNPLIQDGMSFLLPPTIYHYPGKQCGPRFLEMIFYSAVSTVVVRIIRGKSFNHRRKGTLEVLIASLSKMQRDSVYSSLIENFGENELSHEDSEIWNLKPSI